MDIYYEGDAYLLKPDDGAEVVTSLKTGQTVHGAAMIKRNSLTAESLLLMAI